MNISSLLFLSAGIESDALVVVVVIEPSIERWWYLAKPARWELSIESETAEISISLGRDHRHTP
jgi:hypothetical protein